MLPKISALLGALLWCLLLGAQNDVFRSEIKLYQEYFMIPGMAVIVSQGDSIVDEWYSGYADVKNEVPVTQETVFPIASVTKTVCTYIAMGLVEEGRLDLEAPAAQYLPDFGIPDAVKVKHLLSHTSEGVPGSYFNYSSRIGLLGPIVEVVTEESLDQHMVKLIEQLNLSSTVMMNRQSDLEGLNVSKPYTSYGVVEEAQYEFGFAFTAGLAMTARDLIAIDRAANDCNILGCAAIEQMFKPFELNSGFTSPYALGCFSQKFLDEQAVWSYGQYDAFSSLYLKFPERDLTFVLLANNNFMSDPARLIYGNLEYSLFALACYNHFVSSEKVDASEFLNGGSVIAGTDLERHYVLANFLAASFMGQGVKSELDRCDALLMSIADHSDDYRDDLDLTFVHGVMSSADLNDSNSNGLPLLRNVMERLHEKYAYNPYLNYYEASMFASQGSDSEAEESFLDLVQGDNKVVWWYTIEAWRWLGDYYGGSDQVEKSKEYFEKIIDNGWNIGGAVDYARERIVDLEKD